jgi:hypothetical protein
VLPFALVGFSSVAPPRIYSYANTIGQTDGCPKQQQVVCDILNTYRLGYSAVPLTPLKLYMGVAADCEYVSHYGSQSNASRQILTIWNTATALYKVREREIIFLLFTPWPLILTQQLERLQY